VALVIGAPLTIAHRNNLPLERWYGDASVGIAARFGASGVPATSSLVGDRRAVTAGMRAFTGSCAVCHNANGDGKGVFGPATYPPATDLTSHDAQEKTDAQLFWIIKNGLSFTGMPGFGAQYSDQDIWSLVAYIRSLTPGGATPVSLAIPQPTGDQLAMADPAGDAAHRGAAVYFAQGCASCHGAVGNAPGELGLRGQQAREAAEAVRRGRPGMPHYPEAQVSDKDLADLAAYMAMFPNPAGRPGAFGGEREGPGGPGGQGFGGQAGPGVPSAPRPPQGTQ
jgi:mono/diheme cytochrome c family protein